VGGLARSAHRQIAQYQGVQGPPAAG
jgi:hypothetical protein